MRLALCSWVCLPAAGCQQKMAEQPSYKPARAVQLFCRRPLGAARRFPAPWPADICTTDVALFTGRRAGKNGEPLGAATPAVVQPPPDSPEAAKARKAQYDQFVDDFPFPMTRDGFAARLRAFHDLLRRLPRPAGHGARARSSSAATRAPPSYHIPRLRKAPVGHLFAVISEGYGSMPSYARSNSACAIAGPSWVICGRFKPASTFPKQKRPTKCVREWGRQGKTAVTGGTVAVSSRCFGRSRAELARWQRRSLWSGVVVLLVCAVARRSSPAQFFRAYLAAYLFYLGIALGSMVAADGLSPDRRKLGTPDPPHSGSRQCGRCRCWPCSSCRSPAGFGYLYLWAQPRRRRRQPATPIPAVLPRPDLFLDSRRGRISLSGSAMAFWLARWSRQEDQTGNPRLAWKSQQLSGFGAVVYGISIHFAAVDWGMSLQPVFHSTIWGPLFAAGQLLSALAFALVVLAWLVNRPPLAEVASLQGPQRSGKPAADAADRLGLHGLVPVHAHLDRQPAGGRHLVSSPRSTTAGSAVMWAIVLLALRGSFLPLADAAVKRNSKAVAWIAGLILFMQLVFMYYQVMPELSGRQRWANTGWIFSPRSGSAASGWPISSGNFSGSRCCRCTITIGQAALHLRHLDAEEAAREEALSYG